MSENPLPPAADEPPAPRSPAQPAAPVRRAIRRANPPAVLPEGTRYLSAGARFAASIIDSLLILAIITPLIMLLNGAGVGSIFQPYVEQFTFLQELYTMMGADPSNMSMDQMPEIPQPPSALEMLIKMGIPACAFLIFWRYRSATPGKMIFRSRIVDATTLGPPTNSQLVVRYLGYYLGVMTCMMGFAFILFDPRRQGIHDKLANTVVITP